jgi:hypothetical protein
MTAEVINQGNFQFYSYAMQKSEKVGTSISSSKVSAVKICHCNWTLQPRSREIVVPSPTLSTTANLKGSELFLSGNCPFPLWQPIGLFSSCTNFKFAVLLNTLALL